MVELALTDTFVEEHDYGEIRAGPGHESRRRRLQVLAGLLGRLGRVRSGIDKVLHTPWPNETAVLSRDIDLRSYL